MSDARTPRGLQGSMRRFASVPGRQRTHHRRNGAVTVAVLGAIVSLAMVFGYYREIPFFGGGQEFEAEFAHVTNLRVGHPVRVRGVKVGKVTKIERDAGRDLAVVSMTLDGEHGVDLKRDARASIRWRTLLARNMYVELAPGSPAAPALGDARIPRTHTDSQVELDQVFEPLDGDGRAAAQTTLDEFDQAFRGPGAPARGLDRLGPAMRVAAPALQALRGRRTGDVGRLVAHTSRTMRALGRSEDRLTRLIDGADVTFGVTAAQRASLGAFVRQAPATLRDTRVTTARLRTTLDRLDPVARRLRPGARRLDDTARALRPALRQATPLLRDARPLADRLDGALGALRPASRRGAAVIRGLNPTLARLQDPLIPWLNARNDMGARNYQAIGPTVSVVDSSAQQFNSLGNLQRFQGLAGGDRSVGLPCASFFADPDASELIHCQDFSKVLQSLLGGAPTARKKRSR
jgi:virulence factor Mce-like protein